MLLNYINKWIRRNATLPIAFIFFLIAINIHKQSPRPELNLQKQDTAYNLNIDFLKFLTAGNQKMISSFIWIQTLMESDTEKYLNNDYSNWMYLRFNSIAVLDPWFYENYLYGGIYLSVIKDDLQGAAKIFDLGLLKYPEDYKLLYYSGFNYFYEIGDYKRGYEILQKISNHPQTPNSVKFVINKLRYELNKDDEMAVQFLTETLKLTNDSFLKSKIEADIYSIIATRDLKCLNSSTQHNCQLKDPFGKPYIQDAKGNWKAQQEFRTYKIFLPPNNQGN